MSPQQNETAHEPDQSTTGAIASFAQSEAGRAPAARAMRAALSAMIAPAVALDAGGAIQDANRAFCALTGLRHGQLVGTNLLFLPAVEHVATALAEALDAGSTLRVTYSREQDGEAQVLELALGDLNPAGSAVLTLVDVTQVHRDRTQLVEAQHRLDAMKSGAFDAYYLLRAVRDADGAIEDFVFTDVNDAGVELLTLSRDQLLGGRLCELLPVNREHGFVGRYAEVVETGIPLVEEFPIDAPEVRATWLRHQVLRHGDGVAITTRNLSAEKRREQRLHHLQRMEAIARVTSGVAHDFQNVLAAVTGYAALLEQQGEQVTAERRLEWIRQIRVAAASGVDMCASLLDFGGRERDDREDVDPGAVIPGFRGILSRLLGEDHELDLDTPAGLGRVALDRSEVRRMVLNLVVNARDAMPDGGTIAVRLRRSDDPSVAEDLGRPPPRDHVVLSVVDQGEGIPTDDLSRIFEPYFSTKGDAGSGLGLALVFALVEPRGGRVEVRSRVGDGSAFHVLLPIVEAASTPESAEESEEPTQEVAAVAEEPGDASSLRVLLVEDDAGVGEILELLVRRDGHETHWVRNLAAARAVFAEEGDSFTAMLADVGLPDGDGAAFAQDVHRRRPELPIALMSGHLGVDAPEIESGAILFLPKPFRPADVTACLAALVARRA